VWVPYYQLCIQVPEKVVKRLEEVEEKYGVKREDLLTRALMKVLYEEFK